MYRVGKIVPPKRQILKDISLSFFPGAKIGILGLNGSGKSSLLRIMAGVDTEFDGTAEPMANITIGYLEQEPKLDPDKTVRELVEEALSGLMSVRKQLDEAVNVGDTLFIVEAMKMENEIPAHRSGKLETIDVSVGQTVESGMRLATIQDT